jgi:hypothetical protein
MILKTIDASYKPRPLHSSVHPHKNHNFGLITIFMIFQRFYFFTSNKALACGPNYHFCFKRS